MIRVVSEAIILSAYFKEFPQTEEEYRKLDYREFFHKNKIEDMLRKVEKEGCIFIRDKDEAQKLRWHQIVFSNLFKESSRFLHNNPNVLYDLTKDNSQAEPVKLILGPQLYSKEILGMGLRRLFNTTLFSLVTLGVALNIAPDDKERDIMDKANKISNDLNKSAKDNQ